MNEDRSQQASGDPPLRYQPPTVKFIGTVADLTRGSGTGPGDLSNSGVGRFKRMIHEHDRDGNRF